MKRIAALLVAALLALSCAAFAEETTETPRASALQTALTGRPEAGEPTRLVVGNTTKVSGSFFTTFFGNNTSDIDVRTMLHGYSPTVWDNQIRFVEDPQVVVSINREETAEGAAYTVTLQPDLYYNDGRTRITAKDYAFSWALIASPAFAAIGAQAPEINVAGYEAYRSGESRVFSGVRLLDELTFRIIIKDAFDPYFYDLSQIALNPYPIQTLAPGCEIRDDGEGVYIDGPFTAELLARTILDPEAGYLSHPALTSGPYILTSYNSEAGVVDFALNPYYKGNYEGVQPVIDQITLVPVLPEDMIERLASGEVGLLNKAVDSAVIQQGIQLTGEGGFAMQNYPRLGYGFCAFSCEQGPQQFQAVRQALNYAFDSQAFIDDILGGFGLPVYGYYGIGQWMVSAANGTLLPEDMTEAEAAAWDEITLDTLNQYPYNLIEAKRLLIEDGWTLNAAGEPFEEGRDALRYKQTNAGLMPLTLSFAQCADNAAAAKVVALYAESLPQLGASLDVSVVPFGELLADYYRENSQRKYDMNFMATNFVSTFDPYLVFSARPELQGVVNTSGIVDEELVQRAWEMRATEPGDLLTFLRRWQKMQERFNELLPTMPIYSNIYFDFHTDRLQNYYANAEYSWPVAILYAYLGEPAEPEAAVE